MKRRVKRLLELVLGGLGAVVIGSVGAVVVGEREGEAGKSEVILGNL